MSEIKGEEGSNVGPLTPQSIRTPQPTCTNAFKNKSCLDNLELKSRVTSGSDRRSCL